jgi:hypothetical protein
MPDGDSLFHRQRGPVLEFGRALHLPARADVEGFRFRGAG